MSFARALPFTGVSSLTTSMSSVVNGASFTGVTVTANVPVFVPPFPSLTVYVIVGAVPFQFALGVNVYVPLVFTTTEPTPGIVAIVPAGYVYVVPFTVNEICVTDKVFPSASESFVKTLPEAGVSSATVVESFTVVGTSFTGVTEMDKSAVSDPP